MSCTIVWFRRDLRIANNPALDSALCSGKTVLPIYIHNPDTGGDWSPGAASRWWCHHSLLQLNETLNAYGLKLHFFRGEPRQIIPRLISETGANKICWNNLYESNEIRLEEDLIKRLPETEVVRFDTPEQEDE